MLINHPTPDEILNVAEKLSVGKDEVIFLLIAEDAHVDVLELITLFNQKNIQFFGGIVPGVIYGSETFNEGCILKKFKSTIPIVALKDISKSDFEEMGALEFTPEEGKKYSSILIVDPLSHNLGEYLSQLSNRFGYDIPFIGAGVGFASGEEKACVFYNGGYLADTILCCIVDHHLTVEAKHGWKQLAGPFIATKTSGKDIIELNWEKASDIYSQILYERFGIKMTEENFLETASFFPIGIYVDEDEFVIRVPADLKEDGTINTVGEVPQNSVVFIMNGSKETLLEAGESVAVSCMENHSEIPNHTIIIECIGRRTILKEEFRMELELLNDKIKGWSVKDDSIPQGALTYGEICSFNAGPVELFNKTVVIGTFG